MEQKIMRINQFWITLASIATRVFPFSQRKRVIFFKLILAIFVEYSYHKSFPESLTKRQRNNKFIKTFLNACTRLHNLLCPSVRWSAGYDKVPKHASIACRQQVNFVGREIEKKIKIRKKICLLDIRIKLLFDFHRLNCLF